MDILIEYEDAIKTTHRADNSLDSFHRAVGPGSILRALLIPFSTYGIKWILSVLFIAQLFGTMPVCGILSNDTRSVNFCWMSVRFVMSVIFTLLSMMEVASVMLLAAKDEITLGTAGSFLIFSIKWIRAESTLLLYSCAQAHLYSTQFVFSPMCFSSEWPENGLL